MPPKPFVFVPRISLIKLVPKIFLVEASCKAVLKLVQVKEGRGRQYKYPLKLALDKLEGFITQSKAKQLDVERHNWRIRFEATDAYRQLIDDLLEKQREQRAHTDEILRIRAETVKSIRDQLHELLMKCPDEQTKLRNAIYKAREEANKSMNDE